ncbi:MAG TPA: rhamnulokinase family protein [Baekduia sp.]
MASTIPAFAAVDLGASSGRVVVGRLDGGAVALEEHRRFVNAPIRLPDGLRWDVVHLFAEALEGLRAAGPLDGIGVDAWGVDYGLLDEDGALLGVPFNYRDDRIRGLRERAFERVPRDEQYAVTGIQSLPINTAFQLLADEGTAALGAARRIALIPDLIALWLSGTLANESTAASTTGLLDARRGTWAVDLIARLGLPAAPWRGVVEPGALLAPALPELGLGAVPVYAVAGHDTASAFAAAPVRAGEPAAILSSGTWSLLGLELPEPVLSDAARDADLTNERGVDGTTRLLKNVMGLWLEQECARAWGADFATLQAAAAAVDGDVPVFDPDHDDLLAAGDMPSRIAAACVAAGQPAPRGMGETVRAILVSLACKYRWVLDRLISVTGREVACIHVIGGGAQNDLLCRLTADLTGRDVCAGPVEATALGNVLVQARAAGAIASADAMRAVAVASARVVRYAPASDRDAADVTYRRFLDATGLDAPVPTA